MSHVQSTGLGVAFGRHHRLAQRRHRRAGEPLWAGSPLLTAGGPDYDTHPHCTGTPGAMTPSCPVPGGPCLYLLLRSPGPVRCAPAARLCPCLSWGHRPGPGWGTGRSLSLPWSPSLVWLPHPHGAVIGCHTPAFSAGRARNRLWLPQFQEAPEQQFLPDTQQPQHHYRARGPLCTEIEPAGTAGRDAPAIKWAGRGRISRPLEMRVAGLPQGAGQWESGRRWRRASHFPLIPGWAQAWL